LTFDHGPVDLPDKPAGEHRAEPAQRFWMPPEHKAPAGIAVEAMSKRWRMRKTEPQRIKTAFEVRSAPGSRMDRDPGRFVDD
jgi:hypothetical protein